jgi:hypothetical protein
MIDEKKKCRANPCRVTAYAGRGLHCGLPFVDGRRMVTSSPAQTGPFPRCPTEKMTCGGYGFMREWSRRGPSPNASDYSPSSPGSCGDGAMAHVALDWALALLSPSLASTGRGGTSGAHQREICPELLRTAEISATGQTIRMVHPPRSGGRRHKTRPTGRLTPTYAPDLGLRVHEPSLAHIRRTSRRRSAPGPAAHHAGRWWRRDVLV